MKKLTAFFLSLLLMLSLCSCDVMPEQEESGNTKATQTESTESEYKIITQIDHCAVEPDDKLHMTDEDKAHYEKLMNAMLSQEPVVTLSDSKESNEFYIDLLRQSPYFFFVDEYKGKQIPAGKKSVTIRLVIGSSEKTLTGEEIEAAAKSVLKKLTKTLGAEIRS